MGFLRGLRTRMGLRKEPPSLSQLPGLTVGRHVGAPASTILFPDKNAPITIGSFTAIGPEAKVFGLSEHRQGVSTFNMNAGLFGRSDLPYEPHAKAPTIIGNDVWVGFRATILSGVNVGDGAIVGACAVVTKDVPPYAIVVENPARIIRYRFSPEIIEAMLEIRWWEWSDEKIFLEQESFMGPIEDFVERHYPRPTLCGDAD